MSWDFKKPGDFVEYLETRLIPDLKESGSDATAEDFETAVQHINNARELAEALQLFVFLLEGDANPGVLAAYKGASLALKKAGVL